MPLLLYSRCPKPVQIYGLGTGTLLSHAQTSQIGVLLDVEWTENFFVTQEKRLVPAYHKANLLGLQQFLRDKLPTRSNNVEDIWKNFKDIFLGYRTFCSA